MKINSLILVVMIILTHSCSISNDYPSYKYIVTFDDQGADIPVSPNTKIVKSPEKSIDSLPSTPSKKGYIFDGWWFINNKKEVEFTEDTIVDLNITVFCKWTIELYSIAFEKNDDLAIGEMAPIFLNYNSSINLTENLFTKEGYGFLGWATTQNGNIVYKNNSLITVDSNIILYAKWGKNYTVFFNKNDESALGTMDNQIIAAGQLVNLSNITYSKMLWAFLGWTTTPNGEILYINNSLITMGENDIVLYAKWENRIREVLSEDSQNLLNTKGIDISKLEVFVAYDGTLFNTSNSNGIQIFTPSDTSKNPKDYTKFILIFECLGISQTNYNKNYFSVALWDGTTDKIFVELFLIQNSPQTTGQNGYFWYPHTIIANQTTLRLDDFNYSYALKKYYNSLKGFYYDSSDPNKLTPGFQNWWYYTQYATNNYRCGIYIGPCDWVVGMRKIYLFGVK